MAYCAVMGSVITPPRKNLFSAFLVVDLDRLLPRLKIWLGVTLVGVRILPSGSICSSQKRLFSP